MNSLPKRLTAELIGTALLLSIVVGSGIMGDKLSNGNVAIALLANSLATGAGLVVLILMFGKLSGAHFNPIVSASEAIQGNMCWADLYWYVGAQIIGAILGVAVAHGMFDLPIFVMSSHIRSGLSQGFSEFIASFGLIATIIACVRQQSSLTPFAVGAYITSAYWFTASTSFANPAVTLARALTDTFSGIRLQDTFEFIIAQVLGMLTAVTLFQWLLPKTAATIEN